MNSEIGMGMLRSYELNHQHQTTVEDVQKQQVIVVQWPNHGELGHQHLEQPPATSRTGTASTVAKPQ